MNSKDQEWLEKKQKFILEHTGQNAAGDANGGADVGKKKKAGQMKQKED